MEEVAAQILEEALNAANEEIVTEVSHRRRHRGTKGANLVRWGVACIAAVTVGAVTMRWLVRGPDDASGRTEPYFAQSAQSSTPSTDKSAASLTSAPPSPTAPHRDPVVVPEPEPPTSATAAAPR